MADGSEKVSFWEAEINKNGTTSTLSEFLIQNGQRTIDLNEIKEITKVAGCVAIGCTTALVGCAFTNCLYLKCAAGWCVGSLVGSVVGILLFG